MKGNLQRLTELTMDQAEPALQELRRLIAEKDLRITALELMNAQLICEVESAHAALSSIESTDATIQQLNEKFNEWTKDLTEVPHRRLSDSNLLPLMIAYRPAHIIECFQFTTTPLVLTEYDHPYRIIHTNAAWTDLCGYQNHEVAGMTLAFLQGEATDRDDIQELLNSATVRSYIPVYVFCRIWRYA